MNDKDKDKEAFEKWMKDEDRHDGVFGNNNNFTRDEWIADKAWRAACTYKQEEIDELLGVEDVLRDHMKTIGYNQLKKLQAENEKLRECVEFYANENLWDLDQVTDNSDVEQINIMNMRIEYVGGKRARQVLKEIGEIK